MKGGFSFRAKRELGFMHEIWWPSFYDRRVRPFENIFDRTLKSVDWQEKRRIIATVLLGPGLCSTRHLSG